jgi:hypothetical protein
VQSDSGTKPAVAARAHASAGSGSVPRWRRYQDHGTAKLVVPVKKPPRGKLSEDRLAANTAHASLRALVERVNAWLKSFKILATRYRRTWNDLQLTIRCVFRLLRYRHFTSPIGEDF